MPQSAVTSKPGREPACAGPSYTAGPVSLPVVGASPPRMRKSKMGRRRAAVLIAVHVLIIGHVAHWLVTGRTLSPVEPSETMYALNEGYLNAGAIFFATAILATLIFGRVFCGWGCHLLAYQDLCAWLLKKARIKPKPFRSRVLVLAPLALALYMFVWPSVYRWWAGVPSPKLTNHLMTSEFWATFPGLTIAILTFAVCGFIIVYFLGSKGFCTYACPYGGFFALADQTATGRILVTDACEHCGHCTATCSSNVRVHEEVAAYGMVVDPGCMKCMDCVSVCPNDALHFGFARPPIGARPKRPTRPRRYDFSLSEELLMAGIGLAALLTYRGLYGQIPLLFSMGLAAITAYLVVKLLHVVRENNVRLQNLALKRGGRLTRAGTLFLLGMGAWLSFTLHSAAVQALSFQGRRHLAVLDLGDRVWAAGHDWRDASSAHEMSLLRAARGRLEQADRWGLLPTPVVLRGLAWAYLASNDVERAERAVRRLIEAAPHEAEPYRGLAGVLRKSGRLDEAIHAYRDALVIDPDYTRTREELCGLLIERGRFNEALAEYRAGLEVSPDDTSLILDLAELLINLGRFDEVKCLLAERVVQGLSEDHREQSRGHTLYGLALLNTGEPARGVTQLETAVELDPDSAQAQYNLGLALLMNGKKEAAIQHLARAVEADPSLAAAHYNLGVAIYMSGRPADAEPRIREATRLDPNDADAFGFLAVVLRELGRHEEAAQAEARARTLRP